MRRVTYAEATDKFELILTFDNEEYRILNIRDFLKNVLGLLAEIRDDIVMFQSVEIDSGSGNIRWSNGVDIDSGVLYEASRALKIL